MAINTTAHEPVHRNPVEMLISVTKKQVKFKFSKSSNNNDS